jgi:nickel transport protein
MKHIMFVIMAIINLLLPNIVFAHGVEISIASGATEYPVETAHFIYSTGEAMSFSTVRVYAPSRPDVEIIQSITDRNGYFSFVPDETGEWKLTVEDGMGHKGSITINVGTSLGETKKAPKSSGGKLPLPVGIVLGLSILCNIFFVWYYVGKQKKGGGYAH